MRGSAEGYARGRFFYGWVVVAASAAVMFASGTAAVSLVSLFIKPLEEDFGWSRSLVAGSVSAGTVFGGLAAPFIGRVVDRHGARTLLGGGALVQGLAILGLAFTQNIWMLYLFMATARFNMSSVVIVAAPTAVSNWFIRKRAQAIALLIMADRLALATFPPLAQLVIDAAGWRVAWGGLGIATLTIGVLPALLFIRRRPEDMGLAPDGVRTVSTPRPAVADPPRRGEEQWSAKEALRTPTLWLLMAVMFMAGIVGTGIGVHRIPFLTDQGIDPTIAATLVAVLALGMIVGAWLWTLLTHVMPGNWVMALNFLGLSGTTAFLLSVSTVSVAYGYAFAEGIMISGSQSLMLLVIANYYGRASLGTIRGLTMPVWNAGFAVGPLVAGLVFDIRGSYFVSFVGFSVLAAMAGLVASQARRPVRGPRQGSSAS